MKVSSKLQCACRALLQLEPTYNSQTVLKVDEIAEREGLSAGFTLQVLNLLKSAQLVDSRRGQSGGYFLRKDPSTLTLKDIYQAIEGTPLQYRAGSAKEQKGQSEALLAKLWNNVSTDLSAALENWSLQRIKDSSPNQSASYEI